MRLAGTTPQTETLAFATATASWAALKARRKEAVAGASKRSRQASTTSSAANDAEQAEGGPRVPLNLDPGAGRPATKGRLWGSPRKISEPTLEP